MTDKEKPEHPTRSEPADAVPDEAPTAATGERAAFVAGLINKTSALEALAIASRPADPFRDIAKSALLSERSAFADALAAADPMRSAMADILGTQSMATTALLGMPDYVDKLGFARESSLARMMGEFEEMGRSARLADGIASQLESLAGTSQLNAFDRDHVRGLGIVDTSLAESIQAQVKHFGIESTSIVARTITSELDRLGIAASMMHSDRVALGIEVMSEPSWLRDLRDRYGLVDTRVAQFADDQLQWNKALTSRPMGLDFLHATNDLVRSHVLLEDFADRASRPRISALATIEAFAGADAVIAIAQDVEEGDDQEQVSALREEIAAGTADGLYRALTVHTPDLVKVWDGARIARKSTNPDRVRHFAASIRELLTHVLHRLAPDDKVRGWTSDKNHYSNNRPTRQARLLFIARSVNDDAFTKFLGADVTAALKFIDMFQQGTHDVDPPFSEHQLAVMELRAEALIRFLLLLAFGEGDD